MTFTMMGQGLTKLKHGQIAPCANGQYLVYNGTTWICQDTSSFSVTPDILTADYGAQTITHTPINGGTPFVVDVCRMVDSCETTTTLSVAWNAGNEDYDITYTNEDGTVYTEQIGYNIQIFQDSFLRLTQHDGLVVDDVNLCPLVRECVEDITSDSFEVNYVTQQLIHTEVDGDVVTVDVCRLVDSCEVTTTLVNLANGYYEYTNEDGAAETLGYQLVTQGGTFGDTLVILQDHDGTPIDSIEIWAPSCNFEDSCRYRLRQFTSDPVTVAPGGTLDLSTIWGAANVPADIDVAGIYQNGLMLTQGTNATDDDYFFTTFPTIQVRDGFDACKITIQANVCEPICQ